MTETLAAHVPGVSASRSGGVCLSTAPPAGEPSPQLAAAQLEAGCPVIGLPGFAPAFCCVPPGVLVAVRRVPSAARMSFARAEAMLSALAGDLGLEVSDLPGRAALLTFTEVGLGGEDLLVAALASAGPGLPLVGATTVRPGLALDGEPASAVVVLVVAPNGVWAVHAQPFTITEVRTVVTDVREGQIRGLDGLPAVPRFLTLAGLPVSMLTGVRPEVLSVLPMQLGWVVAGQVVARPVLGRRGDALLVAGAVEVGMVLRLLRRDPDPASGLARRLRGCLATLPEPAGAAWLFACEGLYQLGLINTLLEELGVACSTAWPSSHQQFGPVHSSHGVAGLIFGAAGE